MTRRILLVAAILAPAASAACFQEVDTGSVGPPVQSGQSTDSDGAAGFVLPNGFDLDAALTTQCGDNTALCYQLCGSPSCALADNLIPPNLATPPILEPDGALVSDECAAAEQKSMDIRTASCAPCHGATSSGQGGFSFVLDDQKLISTPTQTTVANMVHLHYVIPGDPTNSYIYGRMSRLEMPPPPDQAKNYISPAQVQALHYPTAEDISDIFAWIMCLGSDGGSPYANTYYGGDYGPDAAQGPNSAPASTGSTSTSPPSSGSMDAGAPPPARDAGSGGLLPRDAGSAG